MIISEAFDLLVESELKQTSAKDDKAVVRGYINSGILEIYKRFNLWEEEAVVTIADGVSVYELDGIDANVVMDLSDHHYLMVEEVWLVTDDIELENRKLALNEVRDVDGIYTPKYNRLTISTHKDTELLAGRILNVIYRAAPLFLTNEKAVIPLPPQFQEALFNYVGYRAHSSIKGDEKSENNTHYKRFNASCKRVVFDGLYIQDDLTSEKFEIRGFV